MPPSSSGHGGGYPIAGRSPLEDTVVEHGRRLSGTYGLWPVPTR